MEITVTDLQNLEKIISSAIKTSSEESRERLIVHFNGLTIIIIYGAGFKRDISLISNNKIIKEWHNGDIVYDEIIKELKSLIE